MIESEYKFLINLKSYEKLLDKLKSEFGMKNILQINYYYDTDDFFLNKNDITFRIRQKNEKLNIEIKTLIERNNNLNIKNEYTKFIDHFPLKINLADTELMDKMKYNFDISLKGVLVTERTIFKNEDSFEINLDKNSYLGFIDYELEIEFQNDYKEKILEIINNIYDIEKSEIKPGKNSRFFDRLIKLGKS